MFKNGIIIFLLFILWNSQARAVEISSNPAATNVTTGSGALQKAIEKSLDIKDNHGIMFSGAWISDIDQIIAGGVPDKKRFSANSLLLLGLNVDANKMSGWEGALFSVQFLQFNGQETNNEAGTIQGYNSLPGPLPLDRSELYQLWYRQELFDKKIVFRIGKTVPTFDFNNVIKPVPLTDINIPGVTSLIYTPIFVNTTMLGVLPGYYNSAYGGSLTYAATKEWYINLGIFDGSEAQGIQTGIRVGPVFDGVFYIAELGHDWLLGEEKKPGNFAVGAWHQQGAITATSPNLSENSASGVYLFGTQRLWYRNPGIDVSGLSGFYQYGINNSDVLPMQQFIGAGFTAFGLIGSRLDDSLGAGLAFSWLNEDRFSRRTELMLQAYYQAEVTSILYIEPVLSFIPTPGGGSDLPRAFAGTLRLILLF